MEDTFRCKTQLQIYPSKRVNLNILTLYGCMASSFAGRPFVALQAACLTRKRLNPQVSSGRPIHITSDSNYTESDISHYLTPASFR
jgi:hypothetical protein